MKSFKMVEDVNCSICLDYIIGCRIAFCGHTFCNICITEWLVRKKVKFNNIISKQICPVCRKDIRKQKLLSNKMIDNTVKAMVISKNISGGNDDFERWQSRV